MVCYLLIRDLSPLFTLVVPCQLVAHPVGNGRFLMTHTLLHLSSSEVVEVLHGFSVVLHEFLWYSLNRRDILSTDLVLGQSRA